MPLHLLGKKSWNVYNQDNIDRVRRDEAAAAATEEAEEQRMQEQDSARRTAILRGETPLPLLADHDEKNTSEGQSSQKVDAADRKRPRDAAREERIKRRRLHGEDDTERDMRIARQDMQAGTAARDRLLEHTNNVSKDAVSLTDGRGNITLFTAPSEQPPQDQQKQKSDRDRDRDRNQDDENVGMKFSHAAGYKNAGKTPWYNSAGTEAAQRTDAFGNPDAKRVHRDLVRSTANDPLAVMARAQSQLRAAEKDKKVWEEERRRDVGMGDRENEERRRRKRREKEERERRSSLDSLEGFKLDESDRGKRRETSHGRHKDDRSHGLEHRERQRGRDHDHEKQHRDRHTHKHDHDERREHRHRRSDHDRHRR